MYTTRAGVDGLLRNPDTYIGQKVAALTPGTTVSLDPTQGNVFTETPAQAQTINAASVISGQEITLIVYTSGTTAFTLTFGTNFRSAGTLSTGIVSGKVFTLVFQSDGTNYIELSRTGALA